jgi:hypothetical protein
MNKLPVPVVLIAVTWCLTVTHATRIGTLHELQKENALLRLKLAERERESVAHKTEIARLTAENVHLHAQVNAANSVDDMLEAGWGKKWAKRHRRHSAEAKRKAEERLRAWIKAQHKARTQAVLRKAKRAKKPHGFPRGSASKRFCHKWIVSKTACEIVGCRFAGFLQCVVPKNPSDKCFLSKFSDGYGTPERLHGGGVVGDRCKGRCDLLPTMIDKECTVQETELEKIRKCVVRDVKAPKDTIRWKIYRHSGWKETNDAWPGRVGFDLITCPCSTQPGQALNETEALRRILGQTAAMEPSYALKTARKSICTRRSWLRRGMAEMLQPAYMLKTGVAAFLMLKCWQKHCSQDPAEIQLADAFGGGSEC